MSVSAFIVGDSPIKLWGLTSQQRIGRQLKQLGKVQGLIVRSRHGPLRSWVAVLEVESGPHAGAFAIFSNTRAAYNRG